MIRAIIVDDEKGARESLAKLIEKNCTEIEILAKADSMKTAHEAIEEHHPDLVFLDIEMPKGNAFDLLEKIDNIDFDIIFTTAYDHYAIKAIKFSAIDYILKPVDPDDLLEAVNRYKNKTKQKEQLDRKFKALLSNLNPANKTKRVGLVEGDGLIFVNITDIIRCESSNNYTVFYLIDKKQMVATRALSEYENLFADDSFIRVHRSHLINTDHIKKYIRGENPYVIMSDGSVIPLSRTGKGNFLDKITKL
jgi:two-component system LytT family response regulator